MDYKRNIKYFTSNLSRILLFVSIGFIAVSFVFIFVMWGYYSIGMAFFIPGVFLAFLSTVLNVKDAELDGCAKSISEEFKASLSSKIPALNDNKKYKNFIAKEPLYYEQYYYDGDVVLIKKGKDGTYRSAAYFVSSLLMDTDKIYTAVKTTSLIEDKSEEFFEEMLYSDLSGVDMAEISSENYRVISKYKNLRFLSENGKVVSSIPVLADAEADKTADKLNTLIKKSKAE